MHLASRSSRVKNSLRILNPFPGEIKLKTQQERGNKQPDIRTLLEALKSCGRSRDLESGKRYHLAAIENGYVSNIYVATTAVDMYAKCGSMVDARKIFDDMLLQDVAAWNTLILGYVENGESEKALELFSAMQAKGIEPNPRSFLAAFMACADLAAKEEGCRSSPEAKLIKVRSLKRGMVLHSQATSFRCDTDLFVATTLVDVYAKCGNLVEARKVFQRISRPNVVSWTVLMLGCTENGEGELALELFDKMRPAGCFPDAQAFVAALRACGSLTEKETGSRVDGKFFKLRCLEKAMDLHSQAAKKRCCWNVFVASCLVDVYAKCGSMLDARGVFDRMFFHDVVVWTALLRGYAEAGEAMLALQVFGRMKAAGLASDPQVFVAALAACNNLVGLETGKGIHAEIFRLGFDTDLIIANCLLDFYGKCGSMATAQQVFDSFAGSSKNVVPWNSLIAGYGYQGETSHIFRLFQQMCEEGIQASGITFLCIITACSHVGLVRKGEEYFEAMPSHGVARDLQHYTCMVDLFGRSNHLQRALEFLRTMPMEADAITWTTLLSACKKWKNVEIGKLAFEALMGFDNSQGSYYALMGSIYGSAGMQEEQAKVLAGRKISGAWKETGNSWWIDEKGIVHKFVAGDRNHPQISAIDAKLKELLVKLKSQGYVAEIVVEEEGLCGHSERLAIACALVNRSLDYSSEEGRSSKIIRISKNLRVCEECHKLTCHISQIEKLVIVCRDSSRFHVFADGKCSCNEFW